MNELNIKVVKRTSLRGAANILSDNGRHPLTAMFGRDETLNEDVKGYAVYVVFENIDEHRMETLKAVFSPDEPLEYESLTPIIPAAVWYEREIKDMFGITPIGHPDPRPLVLHESFPSDFHPLLKSVAKNAKAIGKRQYDMAKASGEGVFQVPVGPIHAGIIEPGHFRFSQAGESMLNLDAKLFFTHRGLEKIMEDKAPSEALPIVERICGACSIANTWSYAQAIESIASVKVPYRAELIRTLLSELERITNHVGDLGNMPAGVGFSPAISLGARTKEMLMHLQEEIAGNRFLRGMITIGGVKNDITAEIIADIRQLLKTVAQNVEDLNAEFLEQANFQNRVRTTGIVRNNTAIDLAMVGVGARASSYAHDSRQDFSFGVYPQLDFKIVTEKSGDVAARLNVRVRELRASFSMVEKLLLWLENDNSSDLIAKVESNNLTGESYGICESARGSNFHYVALKNGKIDRIFVRSASYPNWPALPIAVQGDIIPDFPLINKSFELCYACLDR